ncbi:MAG: TIGR00297 family protein, partial [Candidatus Kapabacteria bacterium]|nr:TIGR00297 family protein [Candidatus Kapabacteria bacterium]
LMDSVLGATLQRRGLMTNHSVNFTATLFGALFVLFFYLKFGY